MNVSKIALKDSYTRKILAVLSLNGLCESFFGGISQVA
jgi:hypothetical protein